MDGKTYCVSTFVLKAIKSTKYLRANEEILGLGLTPAGMWEVVKGKVGQWVMVWDVAEVEAKLKVKIPELHTLTDEQAAKVEPLGEKCLPFLSPQALRLLSERIEESSKLRQHLPLMSQSA